MKEKIERENYTRVTTILWPFSGLDKIDPLILQKAANRGTKVHKICESIISGLGEIGVDEEAAPYVESFKAWWGEGKPYLFMERRFWDDDLRITGQCDLILKTEKGLAIVDFKTNSSVSTTWSIQGNAYAYLAQKEGLEISDIIFLHLKKNGKPAKEYHYDVDNSAFKAVFFTWNHFFNPNNRKSK